MGGMALAEVGGMTRKSKVAGFRAPLVVTFVAAVGSIASIGCGGTVDSIDSDPTDVDCATSGNCVSCEVAGTCNPPPPPPPPAECPATAPTQNSSCSGALSCGYGDCMGRPSTRAMCNKGRWQVSTSTCNPPPPPP